MHGDAHSPDGAGSGGGQGRVLVVDDEPALVRVVTRMLHASGFTVTGVQDGEAAVALVATQDFDVIVSDITMPGLDGMQLLRAVREFGLDVPVILMTGAPGTESAIQAVEFGAVRYLVKPFNERMLCDAVSHAARLHRVARLKRQALATVQSLPPPPAETQALEASFERALASLWMAYQPIVRWSGRHGLAYEALMRSEEPSLPHPGAVLHAAEQLGRLEELGRLIRNRVASTIESAPWELVFVNLHTRDLVDDALYSPHAPLSRHARRVVLEITERASLDDIGDVRPRVAALRRLGYRIAVDDLGAGYAGLTAFTQLEPEVVKFDMSLVRGLHQSETKRKLIRSLTGVFRELGMMAIAEGVETPEERDALIAEGCDLFQGYLFARPGPAFPTVSW